MIAQLRINQIHGNLLLPHIAPLRHFRQRARKIDDRIAPIVFG
jgi:hypothetical protein